MLLQVLYDYAQAESLIEAIELTDRTIHLALNLQEDGSVDLRNAWSPLTSEIPGKKPGETRSVLGQSFRMPRFPGENNGGKAHFLADTCGPVLGIEPRTGEALAD